MEGTKSVMATKMADITGLVHPYSTLSIYDEKWITTVKTTFSLIHDYPTYRIK
jgi:hypothetical protein